MCHGACAGAVQTPTKRQKLRHALACQRLGLEAPDSAQLEVERPVASEDVMAESEPLFEHSSAQLSWSAAVNLLCTDSL